MFALSKFSQSHCTKVNIEADLRWLRLVGRGTLFPQFGLIDFIKFFNESVYKKY